MRVLDGEYRTRTNGRGNLQNQGLSILPHPAALTFGELVEAVYRLLMDISDNDYILFIFPVVQDLAGALANIHQGTLYRCAQGCAWL